MVKKVFGQQFVTGINYNLIDRDKNEPGLFN